MIEMTSMVPLGASLSFICPLPVIYPQASALAKARPEAIPPHVGARSRRVNGLAAEVVKIIRHS